MADKITVNYISRIIEASDGDIFTLAYLHADNNLTIASVEWNGIEKCLLLTCLGGPEYSFIISCPGQLVKGNPQSLVVTPYLNNSESLGIDQKFLISAAQGSNFDMGNFDEIKNCSVTVYKDGIIYCVMALTALTTLNTSSTYQVMMTADDVSIDGS